MKNAINDFRYKLTFLALCMLTGAGAFAQDPASTSSSNTTTSNTSTTVTSPDVPANWYMNPLVWVVGGIVLILILFSIFRGSNKSKSEVRRTVTTTTEVNND